MNRLTIALLVAATAGAAGWVASHRPRPMASQARAVADMPRDTMVKQPPNVDPKMVKQPPNVDPKMVKRSPWPKVPAPQPTSPSEQ